MNMINVRSNVMHASLESEVCSVRFIYFWGGIHHIGIPPQSQKALEGSAVKTHSNKLLKTSQNNIWHPFTPPHPQSKALFSTFFPPEKLIMLETDG